MKTNNNITTGMPTINNNENVIVPAVPEKEYPHLWLKSIHISTPSNSIGNCTISAVAYNADTKEKNEESKKNISIRDIWKAVDEVPEAKAAMLAIINAIEPLEIWKNQQQQLMPKFK
jgi:hypothetical protein